MKYKVEGYATHQNIGNEAALYGRYIAAETPAQAAYYFLKLMHDRFNKSYTEIAEVHVEHENGLVVAQRVHDKIIEGETVVAWVLQNLDISGNEINFHCFKL